jgi:hypothetical protein
MVAGATTQLMGRAAMIRYLVEMETTPYEVAMAMIR